MKRSLFVFSLAFLLAATSYNALAQQKFVVNLSGAQEVPANNSAGRGSCTVTLNAAETQITANCTFSGLGSAANAGHIHGNAAVGANAGILFNFGTVAGTSGTIAPAPFNVTPAQVADLRAQRWYVNIHTTNFPGGEIRGQIKRSNVVFDADGDGRTDVSVYRPSNQTFYTLHSLDGNLSAATGLQSGGTLAVITGDYDGDGRGDYLTTRTSTGGLLGPIVWTILRSRDNTVRTVQWGDTSAGVTDVLATADYDGDAIQDIAVFRRSTGIWYIIESSTGNPRYEYWGTTNDLPSVGDYDKDGKADLCVIRNEGGQFVWYIRRSSNSALQVIRWGAAGDGTFLYTPVDVDGDGAQDPLVTRAEGGQTVYYVLQSSNNQLFVLPWGLLSDTRKLGDFDGDGRLDFAARRNVSGQLVWFIFQSSNGQMRVVYWGAQGDL